MGRKGYLLGGLRRRKEEKKSTGKDDGLREGTARPHRPHRLELGRGPEPVVLPLLARVLEEGVQGSAQLSRERLRRAASDLRALPAGREAPLGRPPARGEGLRTAEHEALREQAKHRLDEASDECGKQGLELEEETVVEG